MKFYLQITPAFDRRDPDPSKNYGVHGVNLRWVLQGKLGAVQFLLYTNWQVPDLQRQYTRDTDTPKFLVAPMPADLGYHSLIPQYSGQQLMGSYSLDFKDSEGIGEGDCAVKMPKRKATGTFTPCEFLNGEPCFYDGSGLQAERVFGHLCEEGEPALKRELENYYKYSLGIEPKFWKYLNVFYHEDEESKHWFYIYRHVNGFYEGSKVTFNNPWKAFGNKLIKNCTIAYKRIKSKFFYNSKLYAFNTLLSSQHKGERKNI